MNTQLKNQIIGLAKNSPLEEICGFLYQTLDTVEIYPCTNISIDKLENFEISSDDYIICANLGRIIGIYHSHVTPGAGFSQDDLDISNEKIIPIYLYAVIEDQWKEYIPLDYIVPLEGAQWYWGISDCYSTVRNFFRQKHGIYLSDYDRDASFSDDHTPIILQNFEKEGFVDTNSTSVLRENDVILFRTNMAMPQHFGIFLGNSRMLHHPRDMLSRVELITSNWLRRTEKVLRHKSML